MTTAAAECNVLRLCCEEDCCGVDTEWDGTTCALSLGSVGFQGTHSEGYDPGCVPRTCCEDRCCDSGTIFLSDIGYCVAMEFGDVFPPASLLPETSYEDHPSSALSPTESALLIEQYMPGTPPGLAPGEHYFCNPWCRCCEEECCGVNTEWDGTECARSLGSVGFQGDPQERHHFGRVRPPCCHSSCCGFGTYYNFFTEFCVGIEDFPPAGYDAPFLTAPYDPPGSLPSNVPPPTVPFRVQFPPGTPPTVIYNMMYPMDAPASDPAPQPSPSMYYDNYPSPVILTDAPIAPAPDVPPGSMPSNVPPPTVTLRDPSPPGTPPTVIPNTRVSPKDAPSDIPPNMDPSVIPPST